MEKAPIPHDFECLGVGAVAVRLAIDEMFQRIDAGYFFILNTEYQKETNNDKSTPRELPAQPTRFDDDSSAHQG